MDQPLSSSRETGQRDKRDRENSKLEQVKSVRGGAKRSRGTTRGRGRKIDEATNDVSRSRASDSWRSRGSDSWRGRGSDDARGGGRGGRSFSPGSSKPAASNLKTGIAMVEEDGHLLFSFHDVQVIQIKSSGEFQICCPTENRNADTAHVVSMIIRPFGLEIVGGESGDLTSQWYLTDGKEYRVKCVQASTITGPVAFQKTMVKRVPLLLEFLGKDCLYIDLGKFHTVSDNCATAAYRDLNEFCLSQGWEKPSFRFDKVYVNSQKGFVFTVSFPDLGINVEGDKLNWDADM